MNHGELSDELRKRKDIVARAMFLMQFAHKGQTRRDGETPYDVHPKRVASAVWNRENSHREVATAAALLHDSMEDAPCIVTPSLLLDFFGGDVAKIVMMLTKVPGQSYDDYIGRLIHSDAPQRLKDLAIEIKVCDIVDNLSDGPSERQIEKYRKTLLRLADVPPIGAVRGD